MSTFNILFGMLSEDINKIPEDINNLFGMASTFCYSSRRGMSNHIIVVYLQAHLETQLCLVDNPELPLREQAIAVIEQDLQISLPRTVRVYLADNTRFRLTELKAHTSRSDINARGFIHFGVPIEGRVTVQIHDFCIDDPNSLYNRRVLNEYW
jgi:hypothetical protein